MSNLSTTQIPLYNCIILADNGTAANPTMSFYNAPTCGFYLLDSGTVALSIGGTKVMSWNASGPSEVGDLLLGDGTVTLPAQAFVSSPSTGIYYGGSNGFNIATNGVLALQINSSQAAAFQGALTSVGSVGLGGAVASGVIAEVGATNPATGVNQTAMRANMTASSGATSSGLGFWGNITTAAAAFTMPNRYQFYAANVTKGAGSTITRDISYYTEVPTQGTNNCVLADNAAFTGNFFFNQSGTLGSTLGGILTLTQTTNQIVLGVTNTTTITAPAPAAARVYTIPDAGGAASFVLTAGTTQSIAGTVTFTGQLIGKGTVTNDNAAAGIIGETLISSRLLSAATAASTGTSLNVLASAPSLTAGDYIASGTVNFTGASGTSVTILKAAISKTSATLPASDTLGVPTSGECTAQYSTAANIIGANTISVVIPPTRVSLSGTTSIFLVANATFSVAALTVSGSIQYTRIR